MDVYSDIDSKHIADRVNYRSKGKSKGDLRCAMCVCGAVVWSLALTSDVH